MRKINWTYAGVILKHRYTPSQYILLGLLFYGIAFLLGPYKYTIYSIEGVIYFAGAFLIFYTSTKITETFSKKKKVLYDVYITCKAERFINVISICAIVAFIIYVSELKNIVGLNYEFSGADYRGSLSKGRTNLSRISEVMMHIGILPYLIASNIKKLKYKITNGLSVVAFFMPALGTISVGARGAAVVCCFIFIINSCMLKTRIDITVSKKMKKIIAFLLLLFISLLILKLFITRQGSYSAENLYLINQGDMYLKEIYFKINQFTNGAFEPIYKAANYYTHSFSTFTYFFSQANNIDVSYGVMQFSFLIILLNTLGITELSMLEVAYTSPTSGLYSSFISTVILDYGIIFALVVIALYGIIFGRVYDNAMKGKLGYFILPIFLVMAIISPIYYFWTVGGVDIKLIFCCTLYPIVKKLGLVVSEKQKNTT